MKQWCAGTMLTLMVGAATSLTLLSAPPAAKAAEDNGLFQQMDIGFLSIGGRATYVDPKDGSSRWFGGGQVRLHLGATLLSKDRPIIAAMISAIPASILIR